MVDTGSCQSHKHIFFLYITDNCCYFACSVVVSSVQQCCTCVVVDFGRQFSVECYVVVLGVVFVVCMLLYLPKMACIIFD